MIDSTYGTHVGLGAKSSSSLHTAASLSMYGEIFKLEKTYSIDLFTLQGVGSDADHHNVYIFRVITSEHDVPFVAGLAILSEDTISVVVHPDYQDVAAALEEGAREGGETLGKIGVLLPSGSDVMPKEGPGAAIDSLLKDIFGINLDEKGADE